MCSVLFCIADDDKLVKGQHSNHKKLGSAGLALHYAGIIAQIDTIVSLWLIQSWRIFTFPILYVVFFICSVIMSIFTFLILPISLCVIMIFFLANRKFLLSEKNVLMHVNQLRGRKFLGELVGVLTCILGTSLKCLSLWLTSQYLLYGDPRYIHDGLAQHKFKIIFFSLFESNLNTSISAT